ncbi:Fusaric acid resistance protein-like-domain-containing protein [Zychaea mexicana]|uniref:Fusaric acid resistance protein-like-domain-containing protein n=1 Tax=Zychaea mexicana TaxID=64656 RepID=UPI0022FF2F3D|nr:Fusaric acid resistance protein-like-domain-containing protein [Zychaea mexicana]KAI9474873.1 Fusaric acid resistance protein-like-domain-containing protein [Zychaea mexicana]
MGAQIDATIMAVSGIILAVAYGMAGLAASVAYNVHHPTTYQTHPIGSTVNAIFLLCGIFGAQLLRQIYPKFFFFSLHFMIVQVFTLTVGTQALEIPYKLPVEFGISLLIGCGISLVVNLFIWPETAVDGLGRALRETMTSSKDMLDMITKQFFLDPGVEMLPSKTIDDTAEKMRKNMNKVRTAYKEAKYEVSYTRIRPKELVDIRKSLERITKHLSALGRSLQSERELFDSILASLQNDDNQYNSSSDDQQGDGGSAKTGPKTMMRATDDEDASNTFPDHSTSRSTSSLRKAAMHYKHKSGTSPQSAGNDEHYADDEDDYSEERNQRSVSSLKAFLNIPKFLSPQPSVTAPRKRKKAIHSRSDQNLLFTYLESLREPLTSLSVKCVDALMCVRDSICHELGTQTTDEPIFGSLPGCGKKRKKSEDSKADGVEASNTTDEKDEARRQEHRHWHDTDLCTCAADMLQSLRHFDAAEKEKIRTLYAHNRTRTNDEAIDLNIHEELFMVFFFIFTIREISKELETMTRNMGIIKARYNNKRKRLYIPRPTLRWLRKWASSSNHQSTRDKGGYSHAVLAQYTENKEPVNRNDLQDEYRLATFQPPKRPKTRRSSTATALQLRNTRTRSTNDSSSERSLRPPSTTSSTRRRANIDTRKHSVLLMDIENQLTLPPRQQHDDEETVVQQRKKHDKHSPPKEQQPSEQRWPNDKPPFIIAMRYNIWCFLQYLTKYEAKFALKTAVAVTSLCIPAFVPESAGWFIQDRGQWASVTVIAIMNPTSGGTLHASAWRVVGTIIGAMVGLAALATGESSAYVLAVFAVLLAVPFFYIHLGSTYNKIGIVVLVTYVAVALTRYAQPNPGESIYTTVWKRMVTVIVGIVVAMILNSAVWPFIARHATRKSVSGISNRLGEYYNFLVGTFLYHDIDVPPTEDDMRRCTKIEDKIQASINATSVLLELTDHEPRLKGPFPKEIYREMIDSCQAILDSLGSIRVALLQMPWIVKLDICNQQHYTYRRDMIAALMLHFYTVSSSLASKIPLPVYLPSMRAARIRIINRRRNASEGDDRWIKFQNLSWYCMAFNSSEIVDELEHLTKLVRFIVGEAKYSERAKNLDEKLIPNEQY